MKHQISKIISCIFVAMTLAASTDQLSVHHLSEFGHFSDVWDVQPDATLHLLITFLYWRSRWHSFFLPADELQGECRPAGKVVEFAPLIEPMHFKKLLNTHLVSFGMDRY